MGVDDVAAVAKDLARGSKVAGSGVIHGDQVPGLASPLEFGLVIGRVRIIRVKVLSGGGIIMPIKFFAALVVGIDHLVLWICSIEASPIWGGGGYYAVDVQVLQ